MTSDLIILKKKLVPMLIESAILFIALLLVLPSLIKKYIAWFNGELFLSRYYRRSAVYEIFGIPFLIFYGYPLFKRFIGNLIDLKQEKKETVIVKSSRRNKKDALLRPWFLKEPFSEIDFYYWKCKLNEFSKMKFAIPDTIKGPKGYSEGNYYLVTYYKYSRLVTEVKGPLDPKRIKLISKRYQFEEPPLKSD